jgi:glycosyltransferase involved in cell wall biosynthesis
MRFVFLVPDFAISKTWKIIHQLAHASRLKTLQDFMRLRVMWTDEVHGGTLNIMRHCLVARSCGADAVLATMRGIDSYGKRGFLGLPFIRWADRRPDDVCIVPDYVTELIDEVQGPAIAYLQVPIHTHNNFDYIDSRVALWTDSLYMQSVCRATYPHKEAQIVPNIIDCNAFPYIPQSEREPGLLFAFPRKGPEFIAETQEHYKRLGGTYWRFELISGLSIHQLAQEFRRPQVFLASAEMEGCALPPQESMAAGVVVVGRTAKGANFCMEHGKTAMTAETPEQAARCLLELEDEALRDSISHNAHSYISRYFPSGEPTQFWQRNIHHYAGTEMEWQPPEYSLKQNLV